MWLLPLLQVAEDMQLRSITSAKGRLEKKNPHKGSSGISETRGRALGEGQDFSLRAGMHGWMGVCIDCNEVVVS